MKKLLLITLMLAFGLTGSTQVQFISVDDGTWDTPSTWDQNAVPGAADVVKINGSDIVVIPTGYTAECAVVHVGDDNTICLLTINGILNISQTSGTSLTISHANSQVTVNGTVTYTGNVDVNAGLLIVNGTALALLSGEVYNTTTGKTWMDRNLGASQVATSSTDAAAYGDFYQWGRLTDGHESRTSGTTTTQSPGDNPGHGNYINNHEDWRTTPNDALWQGVSGTNNPCPDGFRLPTKAEWDTEMASWSPQNAAGAFASPLKLTKTGYREWGAGGLINVDNEGYYWSSVKSIFKFRVKCF